MALSNANDRHNQTNTTLQNLLQGITGAPTEQVAAQLLSLQTSLQATLQTTAMLLQDQHPAVSLNEPRAETQKPRGTRGAFYL